MDAASPWRARDAATAVIKVMPGFERIAASSWLNRRYTTMTTRMGMAAGIQKTSLEVNREDDGGLHNWGIGVFIYLEAIPSSSPEGSSS